MSEEIITNLNFIVRNVGSNIKSTKKQYIWEFNLDGQNTKIEFFDSLISNRKKIVVNGNEIYHKEVSNYQHFSYDFLLMGHNCIVSKSTKNKVDLKIDNQSYEHMYNLSKNKFFYSQNPNPTSTCITSTNNAKINPFNINSNFYKVEEKPQLFNFQIKKDNEKSKEGLKKFKFNDNENINLRNNFYSSKNLSNFAFNINNINNNNNNNNNNNYNNINNVKESYSNQQLPHINNNLLDLDFAENNNNNVQENLKTTNDLLQDVFENPNNNNNFYNYNQQNNNMNNNIDIHNINYNNQFNNNVNVINYNNINNENNNLYQNMNNININSNINNNSNNNYLINNNYSNNINNNNDITNNYNNNQQINQNFNLMNNNNQAQINQNFNLINNNNQAQINENILSQLNPNNLFNNSNQNYNNIF